MGDGYLGRYRLDELLGSGGSAEVWRAHDTVTDRTVALKLLAPVLTADPEYRERFEREARAASMLHGPHVVAVHTYGELEGRLFIESEFVDGLDIEALLEWEGPMAPDAAVALIAQVACALDEAHAAGLVHRDVKPQNIIVAPDDVAYLIDFGTALQDGQTAITQIGMLIGTPAYMAPERFDGTVSVRSDIYSLACVLYECLTGERPFRVKNPAQLMRAHLERVPPPPSALAPVVPAALDRVVAQGLAKNPAERYSTAGEFADAARAALTGSAVPGTAADPEPDDRATVSIPMPGPTVPAKAPSGQRNSPEPDPDTRTVALPMDSLTAEAPPVRGWTKQRKVAAAGVAAAALVLTLGAAWMNGSSADSPTQHTRVPGTIAKTPVQDPTPPTTEQPVQEQLPPPEPSAPVAPEQPVPAGPAIPLPTVPWSLPNLPDLSNIPNLDLWPDPKKPGGGQGGPRGDNRRPNGGSKQ